MAEVSLPKSVLRRVLRVSVDDVLALEHAGLHGSHASGMQSFAFTPASAVAAIFAATGQDLGMVGTSSMAHEVLSRTDAGVHISIRFSGLEVGTVGGGTSLPHAQAYLQLMDCLGPGKVYRFAQIIAATALCLEISATASMASAGSHNFVQAHFERGGER
jgi:hydroxymethylglutaryl-CoA reductase (NADPH)